MSELPATGVKLSTIHGETSSRKYYGNRTDYATIYMLVDRVYAGLIELDIERERKAQGL